MTMFSTAPRTVGKNAPTQGSYDSVAITPSDATDLPLNSTGHSVRRLTCTGGGNIAVNLTGGGTATLTGVVAGTLYLCGVTRVLATGTTATGILGLY